MKIKIEKQIKISLTLPDGKVIEITEQEAQKLYEDLTKHFGNKVSIDFEKLWKEAEKTRKKEDDNKSPRKHPMIPQWPTFPGDLPNNPYRPIYCKTNNVKLKDVHTEHCCSEHGCKYGDDDCTVTTGKKKQSFPCMDCDRQQYN
jgi:hypothetical protein